MEKTSQREAIIREQTYQRLLLFTQPAQIPALLERWIDERMDLERAPQPTKLVPDRRPRRIDDERHIRNLVHRYFSTP